VTRTGNRVDELLLYSTGPSEFVVDSLWLNQGTASLHPYQQMAVPELSNLILLCLGLIFTTCASWKKY